MGGPDDPRIPASVLGAPRTVGASSRAQALRHTAAAEPAVGSTGVDVNDWVCLNCKSINKPSAASCYRCGGAREVVAASETNPLGAVPTSGGAATAGAMSLPGMGSVLIGETPAAGRPAPSVPATGTDLAGGLLAGIVAAVVASALWYGVVVVTNYQVGIVAIAVGFIVGQGVVLGARRHGHVALVAISVVLTLLALAISEYLVVMHFLEQEFVVAGESLDRIQPIGLVIEIITESLKADPLTLLFWGIALFQAFVIPARLIGRRDAA